MHTRTLSFIGCRAARAIGLAALAFVAGCQSPGTSSSPRTMADAPRPTSTTYSEGSAVPIRMGLHLPTGISVGEEFSYELRPAAAAHVDNVIVTERIPAGASYLRSEPSAEVQADRLVWHLNAMEPGQVQNIKIWLKAEQEGRLVSCATVSADPRVCGEMFVGKPMLALTKSGPALVRVGDDLSYSLVVRNTGTTVAKDVVVTDPLPEGLEHTSGQRQLSFEIGDLAPNESKSIPVLLRLNQRGQVCNVAVARSSNAGEVKAEACTTGALIVVKITKEGDARQIVGRAATYTITARNEGDVDIPDLTVVDSAPEQTTILEAGEATVTGQVATWTIPMLAKGSQKSFQIKTSAKTAGNICNPATLHTAKGLTFQAEACTEWIGVSGLLVELVDDPDPIQVGETTTFTVRVTNQSPNAEIEYLNLKAVFQDEIAPSSPSVGGNIVGKVVTWPTVPKLAPKQSLTYTVMGKAVKTGDHRLELQVTTRNRQSPVTEVESTTVY